MARGALILPNRDPNSNFKYKLKFTVQFTPNPRIPERVFRSHSLSKNKGVAYTFDKLAQSEEKGSTFDPCEKRLKKSGAKRGTMEERDFFSEDNLTEITGKSRFVLSLHHYFTL